MIIVIGASGHAKEIGFFLEKSGKTVDYFVSKIIEHTFLIGIPVITEDYFFELISRINEPFEVYIGIGNNAIRNLVVEKFNNLKAEIVYPNLFFGVNICTDEKCFSALGSGNIFFPGFIATNSISLGNHNHFNVKSSISHDCVIGDFNTISPDATIAGNVSIGNFNFLGTSASIIENLKIGSNIIIGASGTVINDILEAGTYVGLPAKKIK